VGLALALALAGCSTTPSQTTPSRIGLQGLWAVTPGPGTSYGAGGTTTLEFGVAACGSAVFLSQSSAKAITTCERHIYAALAETLGSPRAYSQGVIGGTRRWVVGARTDDLFYGQWGCGGSTSVNYFNLGTLALVSERQILPGAYLSGIAAIGNTVYVLDENAVGESVLYRVAIR